MWIRIILRFKSIVKLYLNLTNKRMTENRTEALHYLKSI